MTIKDVLEVMKVTNPEMRVNIFDDSYPKGVRIGDVSKELLTKVDSDMLNREVGKIEMEHCNYNSCSCMILHAKETSDMPIHHDHQEFIDLVGELAYTLFKAAGMMDKTDSVEEFVKFLYRNGYKIVKDNKEK